MRQHRRCPRGRRGLGMLVLYLVWGSTYLGHRDRRRDDPAVPHGGDRGSRWRALILARSSRSSAAAAPSSAVAPASGATAASSARLLLGRHGSRRVRRADRAVRDHRAADRADAAWVAIFGRVFLGERLPRAAHRGHRHRASSASRSSSGRSAAVGGALDPLGSCRSSDARSAGRSGRSSRPSRALPPQPLARHRAADARRRARRRGRRSSPASSRPSMPRPSRDLVRGVRLPHGRRQPRRVHDLRLAAPSAPLTLVRPTPT